MKIAWLCYLEDFKTEIRFEEPSVWAFDKVVQIVYAEVQQ